MKHNKYILYSLFLVLVLSSFSSCDKDEDFSILPAETQSGKNTFGCNVEGKKFFGGYPIYFSPSSLLATYNQKLDFLRIYTEGKFEDKKKGIMSLEILKPEIGVSTKIFRAIFNYYPRVIPGTSSIVTQYGVSHGGEVTITKLDTINQIVSGRFNLIAKGAVDINDYSGTDSIRITEGRFDLKYMKKE